MEEFARRLSTDRLISLRRQARSLSLCSPSSAGTAEPLYDIEEVEHNDFVWVFHNMCHETLPTLRKVHKYEQTQSKEANNLALEQQEDEILPAKMKCLKNGRAESLKLPFVA